MRKPMQVFRLDILRKIAQMGTIGSMSTQNQGELVPEWTVGDRLRKARELLELDQEPFAKLIGVSRGTVGNYERGLTEHYKPIVLRAWAMAAGVPVAWIETGTAGGPVPPPGGGNRDLARLTEKKRARAGSTRGHADTRQYFPLTRTAA